MTHLALRAEEGTEAYQTDLLLWTDSLPWFSSKLCSNALYRQSSGSSVLYSHTCSACGASCSFQTHRQLVAMPCCWGLGSKLSGVQLGDSTGHWTPSIHIPQVQIATGQHHAVLTCHATSGQNTASL